MCFFCGGRVSFKLPPRVEFLRRLDQRGHCHWPLSLTGWGCTKFYQGGVPTLIRLGKVSCRQKGQCHWPVSSFLTSFSTFIWGPGGGGGDVAKHLILPRKSSYLAYIGEGILQTERTLPLASLVISDRLGLINNVTWWLPVRKPRHITHH